MAKSKVATLDQALAKINDGMTVMFGGFTNIGSANKFCRALADKGVKDLHLIANDCGNDKQDGIGTLILEHCVKDAANASEREQKIDEFVDTLGRILK